MQWSVLPFRFFFATEYFLTTILQLKVAKRRLFEKASLERCYMYNTPNYNVIPYITQHSQCLVSSLICNVVYLTLSFKDRVLLQDDELVASDKQVQINFYILCRCKLWLRFRFRSGCRWWFCIRHNTQMCQGARSRLPLEYVRERWQAGALFVENVNLSSTTQRGFVSRRSGWITLSIEVGDYM